MSVNYTSIIGVGVDECDISYQSLTEDSKNIIRNIHYNDFSDVSNESDLPDWFLQVKRLSKNHPLDGLTQGEQKHILNLVKTVKGENIMTHVNEMNLGFDEDTTKLSDLEALDLVLQKPEHRASFLEQIDRLVRDKEELLRLQDAYKDLIKTTKDAFKFKTASFINTTVDSIVKDKLEDNIATAVAEADLLEIVKQHVEAE